jgi:DNA-3-methyladenine glycosylase II
VARLPARDLLALGFSANKARALLELAARVESGFDLEALVRLEAATAASELLALRGVGRWTAEYVLLRGLGRLDVFPGDDVGARANLARWMKLRSPLDYERVGRLTKRWSPYAGLVYFHLLLGQIAQQGHLDRIE